MTEVVILISTLIFADLQDGAARNATAKALLRETRRFDAVMNYASAIPDPERPGAVYLTTIIDNQAQQFAEVVRDLDGVYSCYVKPGVGLP